MTKTIKQFGKSASSQTAPTPEQTTEAPAKVIKAKKADDSGQLMTLPLPANAKEGDVYIIVPAGPFGVERWFKKAQMKNIEAGEHGITLTLTKGDIVARKSPEMLAAAKPVAAAAA